MHDEEIRTNLLPMQEACILLLSVRVHLNWCTHCIYNGMFKICRTKTKAQFNHLLVLRLIRFDPNRYTTIKTGTTVNRQVAGKSVCRYLVPGGKSPEQLLWHAGAN